MKYLLWGLTLSLLLGTLPAGAQPEGNREISSLQTRIDAAASGDTLVVTGGTHEAPIVIDRSLVLVGRNRPHLMGDENTHVVTVEANDVTIEGFRITGSGTNLGDDHAGIMVNGHRTTVRDNHLADVLHGVYVKGKDRTVIVENQIEGPPTVSRHVSPEEARRHDCSVPPEGGSCEVPLPSAQRGNGIHVWKSSNNTITHNRISDTRDGIYFSFTDHNYSAHNTVYDLRYGLHFMYSDDNTFEHNLFYNNASGSALMFSFRLTARHNVFRDNRSQRGYGLLLQTMDDSRFANNRMIRNGTGIYLENSTGNAFEENVVSANYRGIRFTGSSMDNQFGRNLIRGNLNTAAVAGMSTTNEWQVDGTGNYWGPRGLLDLDGDGLSELPYRTVDLLGERRETFPYVDLLAASPGLELIAEALRRVPALEVPAITDERPLLRPPDGHTSNDASPRGGVLAFSLTLIAAALTVLWRTQS